MEEELVSSPKREQKPTWRSENSNISSWLHRTPTYGWELLSVDEDNLDVCFSTPTVYRLRKKLMVEGGY